MTRKELIKALRCFACEENCPADACNEKCPYWIENDKFNLDDWDAEISDEYQLCRAAADLLEQDMSLKKELEAAKSDIYELITEAKYPACGRFCKNFINCMQQEDVPDYDCIDHAEWRGPCAENGGKDDTQ